MAAWWQPSERRQVVEWPDGRDWRCPTGFVFQLPEGEPNEVACGFSEPEDARPTETTCPNCGSQLVRTVVRL